jgi:hypothetical protein
MQVSFNSFKMFLKFRKKIKKIRENKEVKIYYKIYVKENNFLLYII